MGIDTILCLIISNWPICSIIPIKIISNFYPKTGAGSQSFKSHSNRRTCFLPTRRRYLTQEKQQKNFDEIFQVHPAGFATSFVSGKSKTNGLFECCFDVQYLNRIFFFNVMELF